MARLEQELPQPNIRKLIESARDNVKHHRELVNWAEDYLTDAHRQLREAEDYLNELVNRKPPSVILRRAKDTWRQMPLTIIEAFNGFDHDHLTLEPKQIKELRSLLAEWDEDIDPDTD